MFTEYGKWLPFITDIYLPICNSENGDFNHLPYQGGIMEQPYITMNILKCIQGTYRKVQYDRMKENLKKK